MAHLSPVRLRLPDGVTASIETDADGCITVSADDAALWERLGAIPCGLPPAEDTPKKKTKKAAEDPTPEGA